MKTLIYGITYPFIWLFSKLPFPILYLISDVFFTVLYYIIGYRRKVIKHNLELAFPEKSTTEINKIQKEFYQYFTDFFIETLKSITISEKKIRKRYRFTNIEVLEQLHQQKRSIILLMAHYGNWEWIISLPLHTKMDSYVAYTKINNSNFEKIVKKFRSKFGMILIKSSEVTKTILRNFNAKKPHIFVLVSDQSPQIHKAYYWRNFFGNKVPVHTGGDMLARKYDYAVVNANVHRVKRGYYEIDFQLITDDAKSTPKNSIIDIYTELMEKHIAKVPAFYLWSHRRFKHMGKEPKS